MSAVQDGKQYMIINIASLTAVDLDGGSSKPLTLIYGSGLKVKYDPANVYNQLWYAHYHFTDSNGDWYSFTNSKAGTAIDSGGLPNEGKQIFGYTDQGAGNTNQQWLLRPIPDVGVKQYQ